MAARIRARHQDEIREKIRASQLVNILEKHAIDGEEMTPSRITAALGLLKKCVPDMQATEHTGEVEVTTRLVING